MHACMRVSSTKSNMERLCMDRAVYTADLMSWILCPVRVDIAGPAGHYWKRVLCRGPEALPRAKSRTLGKDTLCRGPATGAIGKERPSAKTGPRQIKSLLRAAALGKDALGKLGSLGDGGHFPSSFADGHPLSHRQRFFFPVKPGYSAIFFKSLPRALDQALGKDFFKTSFSAKFFFYKSPLPRARG